MSKEAVIMLIAMAAHELNRAYCQALGDDSQLPWDEAPEWQKESAVLGVKLHLENPDAGPQASHESWMAQKVADGWTYGEVKDPEAKEHPCLVPFTGLPVDQQAKDFIFRACVHQSAKLADAFDELAPTTTDSEYVRRLEVDVKTGEDRIVELEAELAALPALGTDTEQPDRTEQPKGAVAAIERCLELIDPQGKGAPEPGSQGYMIEVVKVLMAALPEKAEPEAAEVTE